MQVGASVGLFALAVVAILMDRYCVPKVVVPGPVPREPLKMPVGSRERPAQKWTGNCYSGQFGEVPCPQGKAS